MSDTGSVLDEDFEAIDDSDDVGEGENTPCDHCDCARYLHEDGEGECTCGKCKKFMNPYNL